MPSGSKSLRRRQYYFFGAILLSGALLVWFLSRPAPPAQNTSTHAPSRPGAHVNTKLDDSIERDSEDIFQNEDALFSYVKKFGLEKTISQLNVLAAVYGDCHEPAHKAGRFAYRIYATEVFRSVVIECHAGGFHGAIEAYFRERGTANLAADVRVICRSELNRFFSHQCTHGIGHGLMAAANYELFTALKGCDLLSDMQPSCWTGVFMENIVGSLGGHEGHSKRSTKYLNDDPHYPCTVVPEKYKSSCYFLQTSRMMELFGRDFSKVASACAQAAIPHRRVCFESMGRDVGGLHRNNPVAAIEACSNAPKGDFRIGCLKGAVQDAFWDPAGQESAVEFCKQLKLKAEKDACYQTVFFRAPQILPSKDTLRTLCMKVEASYRRACLDGIKS